MMWSGFALVGLLFLIVPVLATLACIAALVALWVFVFRYRPGQGHGSTCGRCGYPVQGLSTMACPECGADLREVGIVSDKQRGRVGPLVFVLAWTLLLPIPACTTSAVFTAVGPKHQIKHANVFGGSQWSGMPSPPAPTPVSPSSPASASPTPSASNIIQSLSINFEFDPSSGDPTIAMLHVTASTNQSAFTWVNLATMEHTASPNFNANPTNLLLGYAGSGITPASITGNVLDKIELLQLVTQSPGTANLTPAQTAELEAAADEIVAYLLHVQQTGNTATAGHLASLGNVSHNASSFDSPSLAVFLIALAGFLALYIAGFPVYFRTRRPAKPDAPRIGA
ncbi:MAG: hypothetical protein AAF842_01180 [Planctomycetota bacterium]